MTFDPFPPNQERKWREGELEKARRKAQAEEEVRAVRDEQLRQRREAAARAVERERAHWERGREQWLRENSKEEAEGEGRRKVSTTRAAQQQRRGFIEKAARWLHSCCSWLDWPPCQESTRWHELALTSSYQATLATMDYLVYCSF